MFENKKLLAGTCLCASLLVSQPVLALSEMGRQIHPVMGDTITADEAWELSSTRQSSLHDLLPDLIGPQLYRHLLQSDEYITLEGLVFSWWEQQIIKKR